MCWEAGIEDVVVDFSIFDETLIAVVGTLVSTSSKPLPSIVDQLPIDRRAYPKRLL